jgi:hypothetical protein
MPRPCCSVAGLHATIVDQVVAADWSDGVLAYDIRSGEHRWSSPGRVLDTSTDAHIFVDSGMRASGAVVGTTLVTVRVKS